jgi:hypothetical protein
MRRWPRRRMVAIAAVVLATAAVYSGWRLYDRPAHPYNTAYESCWGAAAAVAQGAASTFAPTTCDSPPGMLPGVGRLLGTWPSSPSPGHALVIFATAQRPGQGYEGLAYVVGETPPWDNCVSHLGGPWWQLALMNISSMSCPRGFTYQPGG